MQRENDTNSECPGVNRKASHKNLLILTIRRLHKYSATLEQWWEHEEWHECNGKNQRASDRSFCLIPLSRFNLFYSNSYQFQIFSITNDPYFMFLRNMFDCESVTVSVSFYLLGLSPSRWGMKNGATLLPRKIENCLEDLFSTIILLFLSYTFPRTKFLYLFKTNFSFDRFSTFIMSALMKSKFKR